MPPNIQEHVLIRLDLECLQLALGSWYPQNILYRRKHSGRDLPAQYPHVWVLRRSKLVWMVLTLWDRYLREEKQVILPPPRYLEVDTSRFTTWVW